MPISRDQIDFSLYLVTGRDLVPKGHDYFSTIEEAILGGVAVVQVREKNCETSEFLEVARKTKDICDKYGVPVFINDRIDIALAIGADGVHLGQTDMPIAVARNLLPEGSIIGISCNNVDHARRAVDEGADYIGIGAIYSTQTKKLTSPIVGVRGIGEILECLKGASVKAVGIGGINGKNALRTLHGAVSPLGRELDGLAVVSDIMASTQPREASQRLAYLYKAYQRKHDFVLQGKTLLPSNVNISGAAAALLATCRQKAPLVHQITNNVVMNQSANATLALGASPIMATAVEEMEDLSQVSSALLVNFGTISDLSGMFEAGRCANATVKPIVFDPVAVGATAHRRNSANELLNAWQATVIKGNAAEIGALANSSEVLSKGVDSVGEGFKDPVETVKALANKERCIIVMTGKIDIISDGRTSVLVSNGHPMLANITGSGCMVGTIVATFCGAASLAAKEDAMANRDTNSSLVLGDMLLATVGGVLAITIASEFAAAREDVKGIGTFLPALLDELYNLTPEKIVERAKVKVLDHEDGLRD